MNRRLTVVCAAKLHKNQLERHLELLERLEVVERIIVVRHEPLPERLEKLENVSFGRAALPVSLWRMFRGVDEVLRQRPVDWVIGFNPVPWGTLGCLAGGRRGVKTCLSLIGRDYQQIRGTFGGPFRAALRAADAVTVTGARMRAGVLELGVRAERAFVLPHSVDLERFRPPESDVPESSRDTSPARDVPAAVAEPRRGEVQPSRRSATQHAGGTSSLGEDRYDLVSVGQLIRRKRMDDLIVAIGRLKSSGCSLRLGILGQGPEEARLRALVAQLGLHDQVHFLGFRDDVEAVLQKARAFSLVSEWEGVPFALMEAMATGLVPVVTDVGTIGDWVRDGENGRLVPVSDVAALTSALRELFEAGQLEVLRTKLLAERERLGLAVGVAVWREILSGGEATAR